MLIIGMTCYNAEKFIQKSIQSILLQNEKEWKCFITNDLSTDNSLEKINDIIKDDKRFVIINNKTKHYQTGNYWQICNRKELNKHDVFVELDGDDFFSDADVLSRVIKYYEDPNVYITYGSFVYWNGGNYRKGFASPPIGGIENQRYSSSFTTSHLRTWKIGLFRKLKMEDITEDNGKDFIPVSGDLYFYQCMLEMAREKHSKFIKDINYVYNENDLSEHRVDMSKVFHYTNKAKTRKVKQAIDVL